MGQDIARQRWKIVNSRKVATVSEVIDILLENRNLDRASFSGELKDLAQHLCIRGMAEGAGLLAKHITCGDKVVVVADYDCDGITSAAQMAHFFQDIGYRNFEVVIPSRSEGYGIPPRAISDNPDAKVFIALDCGTLDFEPVEQARSMGAQFIVIDHHEVPSNGAGPEHAPATVLINPKHPECGSPFKEFCASGLTFLFLAALRQAFRKTDTAMSFPQLGGKYLALAATGTVSDLVPLVSGNRILTLSGLQNLNKNSFAPLSELAQGAGLAGKTLTAGHIGFYLGPRINAAGRISEGQIAYDLLTAREPAKLAGLAAEIEKLNGQRRAQEGNIVGEIASRLAKNPPKTRTLVLASPGWQPGVVGIAASKVQQDLYFAPVVIFSIDEASGIARGSARSIPGFNIHSALSRCSSLLIRWGGHKAAAGLTLSSERIAEFAERLEEIASEYPAHIFIPHGKVDLELPLPLVGLELFRALEKLEPHGMGNPAPVFGLRGAKLNSVKVFGKEKNHLRLEFAKGVEALWWRGAHRLAGENGKIPPEFVPGQAQDIIFRLAWDSFRNKVVLEIVDLGHFAWE
ncbi:MAG: single-stranded-DNA-specific exonuclease RecJ [Syntrophobacteraceae bacterium]